MFQPTKILIPTDFSEHSDKAVRQGLDIARQYNAKVFLLHVIHEEIHRCAVDYCLSDEMVEQFKKDMSTAAKENLQAQLDKFPEAKGIDVTMDVKKGVPYEAILKEEHERGVDLIVIASMGRSSIAKYLMGSVARNVAKGAKCQVLLVRQ